LDKKVVLISGASRGIGEEAAKGFAKEGYCIAITHYGEGERENALSVASECKKLGAKDVLIVQLDVLNDDSIEKAVGEAVDKFGFISILVNNAGVFLRKPLVDQSKDEIEALVRTNLEGLIKLTKACLPHVKDSIINVSSKSGKIGAAYLNTYCASKFGVRGFTKALAIERGDLKVYCVNPDMTATKITDYEGRAPEDVAEIIVEAAKTGYNLPSGSDIDVWSVLDKKKSFFWKYIGKILGR